MTTAAYTAHDLHNANQFAIACRNIETRIAAYYESGCPSDITALSAYRRRADEYASLMPRSLHRDVSAATLDGWDAARTLIHKLRVARRRAAREN